MLGLQDRKGFLENDIPFQILFAVGNGPTNDFVSDFHPYVKVVFLS